MSGFIQKYKIQMQNGLRQDEHNLHLKAVSTSKTVITPIKQ